MKFDDALQLVGELGRYQKVQVLLLSLVVFSSSCQIMMTVFTLHAPDHRCAAPGVENDTFAYLSHSLGNLTDAPSDPGPSKVNRNRSSLEGVELSQCHIRFAGLRKPRAASGNHSQTSDLAAPPDWFSTHRKWLTGEITRGDNGSVRAECVSWVYDQSVFRSTIATQMNFVCARKLLISHALMMIMLGQVVGSLFGGTAADFLGRKKLMVIALLLHFVTSVLTAVVGNIITLGAVYLLNGLAISASYCTIFTLVLEQVGLRWRHVVGILCTAVWSVGMLWVGLLSYILRDWRQLQLAASLPAAIFVFYVYLVPESARWLAEKGRYSEAEEILERMARKNRKQLTTKIDLSSDSKGEESHLKAQSLFVLMRCPPLLLRLAVVLFNWFAVSLTYYGLTLNVGQLSGNIHLNFVLSALFELAGFTAAIFLLYRVGRKRLYCSALLLGGAACLLTVIPVLVGGEGSTWAVRALAMTGKFGVAAAFAIVWLLTPEMFPTSMRAGVTGASSCSARVGGVAASYLANLTLAGPVGQTLPQIIFGSVGMLAGLLALSLPETNQARLPDTIEDAVQMRSSTETSATRDHQTSLLASSKLCHRSAWPLAPNEEHVEVKHS